MSQRLPIMCQKPMIKGRAPHFLCFFIGFTILTLAGCQERLVLEERTPFGTGGIRMGDTAIAEIDGTKIYLSDIERTAIIRGLIENGGSLVPGDPVFQTILDEKIDQRLLALEAFKQAIDQNNETRRRLNEAKERILANVLIETYLSDRVNEETLRNLYEAQTKLANRGVEMRVRQIVVETEEDGLEILERLKKGESFKGLARKESIDEESGKKGGDLGFVTRDMMPPAIAQIAFQTDVGALSDPFKTSQGWTVLKVEDRRRPAQSSFEDMRDELKQFMTYDEMQKLIRNLRTNGEIKFLYGKSVTTPQSDLSLEDTLVSDIEPETTLGTNTKSNNEIEKSNETADKTDGAE